MIKDDIRQRLLAQQDKKYKEMQERIINTVPADSIIGVRTPELRQMAKELSKMEDVGEFLSDLPHELFEEDQLHAFIISGMRDYSLCMAELVRFLPYVNNWATCDQMSPKVFRKHKDELLDQIKIWIASDHTYTVRFGVGMLMEHFLDEDFDIRYPKMVAKLRSDEYYVNMMIAWYFATALAKQYDDILPFIEKNKLDTWTHNKTIQKACESFRITPEQKEYLKSLKIKKDTK
ncbi:MAG: DNA alkylation repair protein [Clostridiales bacterium]|nr:DNA alkylation repair protein [Clostridiales bacterium]